MGDRGNKYYAPTGETTEWEDILVKKGIIEPRYQKEPKDEDFVVPQQPTFQDRLVSSTLDELDEIEEDDFIEDEKMLQQYRERRIQEMRAKALRAKYGDIYPITKDEWVREVTEASEHTWVVVFMFKSGIIECNILEEALRVIARKFREVKFVKIVSTNAIEKWPDSNLPTLFLYHKKDLQGQLLGLRELGGKGMTPANLEWYLAQKSVVDSELEEDPKLSSKAKTQERWRNDSDSDD